MQTKKSPIILWILMCLILYGCQNPETKEKDLMHMKSANLEGKKKVILLMADSLLPQAIDRGLKQNELPALQFLIDRGQYVKDMITSFPTMSVTIDSSLLTGTYPDGHRVPGLNWYSAADKKLIIYGSGPMEIVRHGINLVTADALINLNGSHLNPQVKTVFEELARRGKKTGSINGLIYRGTVDHTLSIPQWAQGMTGLPKQIQVKGPDFLALGSLSNPLEETKDLPDGVIRRMGLNNQYAVDTINYLIKANKLPDFLYVYLPDLDQKLHKKGPSEFKGVKETDRQIDSILQSFGSREEAVRKAIFIVMGDSGVTQIRPATQNPVVDLPSFFPNEHVLRPGEPVSPDTDIILAVNETMAYVYKLNSGKSLRDMADLLKKDARIDCVSWKENGWIYAVQGKTSRELRFKANGKLMDPYRQGWKVEKDAKALDLKINRETSTMEYGQYPDVLKRLSAALHSHPGEFLVVAAKPGNELADRSSPTHKGGGGHGSLSKEESFIPFIVTGTDKKPEYPRIIDVKAYILDLLK